MSVDYQVRVIPQQRDFRPSAEQVASLANALREDRWVPKPEASGQRSEVLELLPGEEAGKKPVRKQELAPEPLTASWIEFHSQHELVLNWDVRDQHAAGVQYPFNFDPYPDSGPPYFRIYLILGDNYFHWTGENVMPFDEQATKCTCGEQLAYWTGWAAGVGSERIHRECPKCKRSFVPSGIACDLLDGWTGNARPLIGGLTFRFALVVDCHKYWPHEEEIERRFSLRPEFLEPWQTYIHAPLELVVTFD
jgi:hypothetical protein